MHRPRPRGLSDVTRASARMPGNEASLTSLEETAASWGFAGTGAVVPGEGPRAAAGGLARCQRLWKMIPQPRDRRPQWLRQYEVGSCIKKVTAHRRQMRVRGGARMARSRRAPRPVPVPRPHPSSRSQGHSGFRRSARSNGSGGGVVFARSTTSPATPAGIASCRLGDRTGPWLTGATTRTTPGNEGRRSTSECRYPGRRLSASWWIVPTRAGLPSSVRGRGEPRARPWDARLASVGGGREGLKY